MADTETPVEPKVYRGGPPLNIDVNKLVARFGIPAEGTLISHEEIERCIGAPWKSSRYENVLDEWRDWLVAEPRGLDTIVKTGQGLYILRPDEAVDAGADDFRTSTRKMRKAATRVIRINPARIVNPVQAARRDHLVKITSRLLEEATKASKALAPPPSVPKALPRRTAPA